MKLISTKLTNIVSSEQSHKKPLGMYGSGLLKFALGGKSVKLAQRFFRGCTQNKAGAIIFGVGAIFANGT